MHVRVRFSPLLPVASCLCSPLLVGDGTALGGRRRAGSTAEQLAALFVRLLLLFLLLLVEVCGDRVGYTSAGGGRGRTYFELTRLFEPRNIGCRFRTE